MKVKFDGYCFADRLLEEVYFQADIVGTNVTNVEIHPDSDTDYWDDLNQAKWLKKAKGYLELSLKDRSLQEIVDNGEWEEIK